MNFLSVEQLVENLTILLDESIQSTVAEEIVSFRRNDENVSTKDSSFTITQDQPLVVILNDTGVLFFCYLFARSRMIAFK